MAAIAYPELRPARLPRRPELRILPPVEDVLRRSERSSMAAVYRRRRAVALLVAAMLVAGVAVAGTAIVGRVTAPSAVPAAPASAAQVLVVQPGDTLWSIAVAQGGGGDVRERVDALVAANGGSAALQVGDRIVVP